MINLLFTFIILCSLSLFANDTPQDKFQEGINSFKQQNYKEAINKFSLAIKESPSSVNSLYNLGLAELKNGNFAAAAGYWRRVLHINPWHRQTRRSLKSIEKNLPRSGRTTFWEKFRGLVLSYFTLQHILIVFTLVLVGAASTAIKYFSRRYIAFKNNFPMPPVSSRFIFLSASFFIFSFLLIAKVIDIKNPRATTISNGTPVYLSPNSSDIVIHEILPGSEIIIDHTKDLWAKIQTRQGNRGWVETKHLLPTSGELNL